MEVCRVEKCGDECIEGRKKLTELAAKKDIVIAVRCFGTNQIIPIDYDPSKDQEIINCWDDNFKKLTKQENSNGQL